MLARLESIRAECERGWGDALAAVERGEHQEAARLLGVVSARVLAALAIVNAGGFLAGVFGGGGRRGG